MTIIDFAAAQELTGLSGEDLRALVELRYLHLASDAQPRLEDIPHPVDAYAGGDSPDQPFWSRREFEAWAMRTGYNNQALIGYTGLARLTGLDEQSLRKRVALRLAHIRDEGQARLSDIPAPTRRVGHWALFDAPEVRRWAEQTGRVNARQ